MKLESKVCKVFQSKIVNIDNFKLKYWSALFVLKNAKKSYLLQLSQFLTNR